MTETTEFEIFRITPDVNDLCYEYAESTRIEGRYPNERHFTNIPPLYVGRLIQIATGGYGDNRWRTDLFQDNLGDKHTVKYSYEGKTCFRIVPCRPAVIPSLESLCRVVVKNHVDYSELPENDIMRNMIHQSIEKYSISPAD